MAKRFDLMRGQGIYILINATKKDIFKYSKTLFAVNKYNYISILRQNGFYTVPK